jgi:hypothetical protein
MESLVKLEIQLPFYSWTLNPRHDYQLEEIPFKGKLFSFKYLQSDETKSIMQIQVSWQTELDHTSNSETDKIQLVEKGIDFLNYLIYHSRTLDQDSKRITFVSPRSVPYVKLAIGDTKTEAIELTDNPPQEFLDLISYADHFPESYDTFTDLMRDDELGVLDFNLIVDAYHAIYESRYSESIINCLTAIESRTFPLLTKWMSNCFLNKSEKNAENNLIEMPFGSKMEILFGSIYPKALKEKFKLLEDLKGVNRLRNEIIHKGKRATKLEAKKCLKVTSEFLMIVIFDNMESDE